MSYSFDFTVTDKAAAKERLTAEFEQVVSFQAIHSRDREAATAAANAAIDLLRDDEACDVRVMLSGSLSYQYSQTDPHGADSPISQAAMSVNAWLMPRAPQ